MRPIALTTNGAFWRESATPKEGLAELYDADPTSLTRSNFLVTAVDGVVELIEAFGVVAILAPLARSRQETVLAFECSNDDPHSVSDPCRFLFGSVIPITTTDSNVQPS